MSNFTKTGGSVKVRRSNQDVWCCSMGLTTRFAKSMKAIAFVMLFMFSYGTALAQEKPIEQAKNALRTLVQETSRCGETGRCGEAIHGCITDAPDAPTEAEVQIQLQPILLASAGTIYVEHNETVDGDNCEWTITHTYTVTCDDGFLFDLPIEYFGLDDIAPVITTEEVGGDLGCNPDTPSPVFTATDNCGDGELEVTVTPGQITEDGCFRSQTFTANAVDACDNAAEPISVTYTWTEDTEAPTINTLIGGRDLGCNPEVIPTVSFFASDNCGEVTPVVVEGEIIEDGCFRSKTYTANATDACGNQAIESTITFTWTEDNEAPVISTNDQGGDLGCNPEVIPVPEFTANDNCGVGEINVEEGETVIDGCSGSKTYTATAMDACENESTPVTVTYTWTVDTEKPVISAEDQGGDLGCNPEVFPVPVFTATDNCSQEEITVEAIAGDIEGEGCSKSQTFTSGAYSDACGNTADEISVTYTWTEDTEAPEVSVNVDSQDFGCNPGQIPAPIFTASDNCKEDWTIENVFTTNGPVDNPDVSCGLMQSYTAFATDDCENRSEGLTVTYTWTVDTDKPVISTEDQGGDLGCNPEVIPVPEFMLTEACSPGDVIITSVDGESEGCARSRTYFANFTDDCDNMADEVSVTYTWTSDDENPTIDPMEDVALGCNPGEFDFPVFTATDNCGVGSPTVTPGEVVDDEEGCGKSQTFTANVKDNCGNDATPVTVTYTWTEDTELPVITAACEAAGQDPDDEECYGVEVLSYTPGTTKSGAPIAPNRMDPTKALGAPQNDDTLNFVSLGYGGEIIIGFADRVYNLPGNDISTLETSYGGVDYSEYPESAEVWVAQEDGIFYRVGQDVTNAFRDFDISNASVYLPYITQVKLIDNTPAGSTSDDGYDLDGIIAINGCSSTPPADEDGEECYGAEVLSYTPGITKSGAPIAPNRMDPTKALGAPQNDDTLNFVSLGYGGEIIIGFAGRVYNLPGNDISTLETSYGGVDYSQYAERAEVWVAMEDGVFYQVGQDVTNAFTDFDISDASVYLPYITQVKLIDITPEGSASEDGFDLDGIVAIRGCGNDPDEDPNDLGCNPDLESFIPVFTVSDNCSVGEAIVTNDGGVADAEGCGYSITYTANYTDDCGNEAVAVSCTYTYTVDLELPVIATEDEGGDLGCNPTEDQYSEPDFTVSDNCSTDIEIVVTTDGVESTDCSRSITYTANAQDECGNNAEPVTVTYTWTEDTDAPTIDVEAEDMIVECDGEGNTNDYNAWIADNGGAQASDLCGDITWTNSPSDFNGDGCIVNTTVTFKATDACGNFATTTATFTVSDTQGPEFDFTPDDVTVECITDVPVAEDADVSATDLCSEGVEVTSSDSQYGDDTCDITITRTWTATDACGNTTDYVQNIYVRDTTAPVIACPSSDEDHRIFIDSGVDCTNSWEIVEALNVQLTDNCSPDRPATPSRIYRYSDFSEHTMTDGSLMVLGRLEYDAADNLDECGNPAEFDCVVYFSYLEAGQSSGGMKSADICSSIEYFDGRPSETKRCSDLETSTVEFTAYPVPFENEINISYSFDYDTKVDIKVFDTRGVVVSGMSNDNYIAGTKGKTTINLSRVSTQLLYVKVETDRGEMVKKIVSSGK